MTAPANTTQRIKTTRSRCLSCLSSCAAEVWLAGENPEQVFMKRTCPDHGEQWTLLSSDSRFYWQSQGSSSASEDCCQSGSCCTDGSPSSAGSSTFEQLSTCVALIEIVNSCNLKCPTCFADSLTGPVDAVPLDEIKQRIEGVIQRKGGIEILQLSGGEPTLHPQFFELLEWANQHSAIDYILINTNGLLIAKDDAFLAQLGKAVKLGHMQVYLQYDGPGEAGHTSLRGADLRKVKQQAIERCEQIELPVTLAMTVIPDNLDQIWNSISFGLQYPHVRGISFQPMFGSGRTTSEASEHSDRQLNVADIILSAITQSDGQLKSADFTPLPCGDPNCATIGYLLKINGEVRSISDFVDFSQVQDFLSDRLRYSLEDLASCGCDSEPLGALLKQFELDASHTFRLLIKPFMDARSWDDHRIDRCCTHVIRPDGKLDSFCRYYSGFSDCQPC
ncbi:MAG: radical SAM protein [Verrucomicrobiales bacterium]|nr:radical SAM protein [Verrucomicrobiales bacterium]